MTTMDKITAAINACTDLWPNHDGPGHIVYADFNLRDSDLQWCIGNIDRGETYSDDRGPDHPILVATRALFVYLLEIPEADRLAWADHAHEYIWGYGVGAQ